MKNQNVPAFHINPDQFGPPQHEGPIETFGRQAVITHELAVSDELAASHLYDGLEWIEQTQHEKIDPRSVSSIRLLGYKALGHEVMSDEEIKAVEQTVVEATHSAEPLYDQAVKGYENVIQELYGIRKAIGGLKEHQNRIASDHLIAAGLPTMLLGGYVDDVQKGKAQGKDAKTIMSWLATDASDDQLLNTLQWHNAHIEAMQTNPELMRVIEDEKLGFKDDVARGVTEGWLSPKVLDGLESVDSTEVVFQDVFGTSIHGVGGYYELGKDSVAIAAGATAEETQTLIRNGLAHELTHKEIGMLGGTVINEALTEHIRLSLREHQAKVVSPDARYGEKGVYKPERQLLADFLDGIDPAVATRAYSGTAAELEQLEEKLNERWLQPGQEGALMYMNLFLKSIKEVCVLSGRTTIEANARAAEVASETLKSKPEAIFFQRHPDESPKAWVLTA